MLFKKWKILTRAENPKVFEEKRKELIAITRAKTRRHKFAREGNKSRVRIGKDATIFFDLGATHCVMVILYDKRNYKGAIVHVEEPTRATGTLQEIISKMYVSGSKNISAVMLGGNKEGSYKAVAKANWKTSEKVLKQNHVHILRDYCVQDTHVETLGFWLANGRVKCVMSAPRHWDPDVYCEFSMKNF